MSTPKLLKEYIQLLLEVEVAPMVEPFVIKGVAKKSKGNRGGYAIYREFPVVIPPGMMDAMRITPDELDANGAVDGEHEIIIDVDVYYRKSTFKGSHLQPPDPDEFDVEGWEVESIDGFELSPEDAAALKAYLGELTDNEFDNVQQAFFDRGYDEPDYPEPDDYDFDDRY